MKQIFFFTLLFAAGITLSACDDDEQDTTKPVIENFEPEENAYLQIGKYIHFQADISDNKGLKSYKIDIHDNFDNHGHKAKSIAETDSTAFHFTKVWTTDKENGSELLGVKNAHLHHHEIFISPEINEKPIKPGNYHFILYVLDEEGNESMQARSVILTYNEVLQEH